MQDFTREPGSENIFEGTTDEVIELILRIKDEFSDHYDNNSQNELKFEQIRRQLANKVITCYFQKQKEFEKVDKLSGAMTRQSTHKIIIPLENEKVIEGIISLYDDEYSYRIVKLKQIFSFNPPTKNFLKRNCKLIFKQYKDYKGFTASEKFKELYELIEQLQLPILDINKEKDKEIWKNYVIALKRLVKQKEQVWKIQNIKTPYSESREGENERTNYIDIYINEKDLTEQFEKEIENLFDVDELEDYGASEDKAFIEFKNYRELSSLELAQLEESGGELFFELSKNSPSHFISGEIQYKYSDIGSKQEILEAIKSKLVSDYQLESEINEMGYIDLPENNIPYLRKILSDYYNNLLTIYKENLTNLHIIIQNNVDLVNISKRLKRTLDEIGLTRNKVTLSSDNHNVIVELGAFLYQNGTSINVKSGAGNTPFILSDGDLNLVKTITRISGNKNFRLQQVDGLSLVDQEYQITNASREDIDFYIKKLKTIYPGIDFSRRPSYYYLAPSQQNVINQLRDFKRETDLLGKTEFLISSSILRITADNENEYNEHLDRIKNIFPDVVVESRPYKPNYLIQFKTDITSYRQNILNNIQNELRVNISKKIEFEPLKNFTRVLFSYSFSSDDEREMFKQAIIKACVKFSDVLTCSFENELGRTLYELHKNETLELEKEKEVAGNVRQATFIYLTPEQKDNLNDAIELYGDDARFREGIQIGKLVKKDKNLLKFRINEAFDEMINGKEDIRVDLAEIRKGYIKPIFPGELTNIERMIRAMKKVTEPGNRVGFPVNRNLSNFLFDPNEARQSSADIEVEKLKVIADLNEPMLRNQERQLEAVTKSLLAKDLALIQGPPGTGKTTVIAEIIWQTLLRDPASKILITSQTNLAVDNALERLKGKKIVRPLRIGSTEKFEDEGKVYSNERIRNWIQAKSESTEEQLNADNSLCEWIDNVNSRSSKEERFSKAINKWTVGLSQKDLLIKNTFSKAYYKNVNIFAATCSECGSPRFSDAYQEAFYKNSENHPEMEFDVVIMDEASKATPPELVLPLTLGKKVIIIGDHKQLPPMIDEREFSEALEEVDAKQLIENWTKDDYKTSQFEKLFINAPKNFVATLDTQFRMHEQIMNCISQFYSDQVELENGLICGIKGEMDIPDLKVKASRWHGLKSDPFIDPKNHAIWVNVETPEKKVGTSYENQGELNAILIVLRALTQSNGYKEYFDHFVKDEDREIGIITYYMPQMQKIRKTMYPTLTKDEMRDFERHKYENEFQIPFRINTVDRFQGMERNIIIISTVRSNKQIKEENGRRTESDNTKYPKALGFAKELQRINVGFSRAKRLLIVIGNEAHFAHKSEYADAIQKMHRIDLKQIENLITE